MTKFTSDVVDRIERFRQPNTQIESLYPIFEAINNALDAVDEKFKEEKRSKGLINIKILPYEDQNCIASVHDNGTGLNKKNFDAYTKVDTPNKINVGGKGVGRLYWLHAFDESHIESIYENGDIGKKHRRKFINSLNFPTYFKDIEHDTEVENDNPTGTKVAFYGFRDSRYENKFPKKEDTFAKYIVQHFLSIILSKDSPRILFTYRDNEEKDLSNLLRDYIVKDKQETLTDFGLGEISLHMLKIREKLKIKSHLAYLVADSRTVISTNIDNLLGFNKVGEDNNLFFGVCISGKIFDKSVEQDRTRFGLEPNDIKEIIKKTCEQAKENFLFEEAKRHHQVRLEVLERVLNQYPSIDFDTPEKMLEKIPEASTDADEMYGAFSRERYRRDRKTETKINGIIDDINSKKPLTNYESNFSKIAKLIKKQVKNSLAEYIVRRKVVLDLLNEMIKNYPSTEGDDARKNYFYEEQLHNFICPKRDRESNHELWVVTERLTFSKYLYSDEPIRNFLKEAKDNERPDIISFDKKFLLQNSRSSKILIVEFKRPGRKIYDLKDDPVNQIKKYVEKMFDHTIEQDIEGEPIGIDKETTIFACYVIADIVGGMRNFMNEWDNHPYLDGSKIKTLKGVYRNVTIEVIPWKGLLEDAHERNKAFFERLGINKKSP